MMRGPGQVSWSAVVALAVGNNPIPRLASNGRHEQLGRSSCVGRDRFCLSRIRCTLAGHNRDETDPLITARGRHRELRAHLRLDMAFRPAVREGCEADTEKV